LKTVITNALQSDLPEIQDAGVELSVRKTQCDPSAPDYVSTHISSTIYVLQSGSLSTVRGHLQLLSSFFENNGDVCAVRSVDLFPALTTFMTNHPTEEFLPVLALLCEKVTNSARQFSESLIAVFRSSSVNFHSEAICKIFARIIRVLGTSFSSLGSSMIFSLFPSAPECFFIIAGAVIESNPTLLDRSFILGAFERADLSTGLIDAWVSYAKH
jgi:hypothetical protein